MRYLSILLLCWYSIGTIRAQVDELEENFCVLEKETQRVVIGRAPNSSGPLSIYGDDFTPKGDLRALAIYVDFEGSENGDYPLSGWPPNDLPNFVNDNTGKIAFAHDDVSQFSPIGNPAPDANRNISEFFYHMSNGEFRFYLESLKDDNGAPVLLRIDASGATNYSQLTQRAFVELNTLFPNRDWGSFGYDTRPDEPNFQVDASATFDNPQPDNKIDFIIIYFRNRRDWDNHPTGGTLPMGTASASIVSNIALSNGYTTDQGFTFRQSFNGTASNLRFMIHELAHNFISHPHTGLANSVHGKYLYSSKDWSMMDYGVNSSLATAWERWYSGWIDIKHDLSGDNASDNGIFQLGDYMQTGDAMRLKLPYTQDQFLWLTFRSDTDNPFYQRTIPDSWVGGYVNETVPVPNEGLFGLFERIGDAQTTIISALSLDGANGSRIMPGTGLHDYIIDEMDDEGRPNLSVTRKKANPFGQQGEPSSFKADFNNNGQIAYTSNTNAGSPNEYGYIVEVNNNPVYGRNAVNPDLPDGKYSSFTNPPITNFLEYSNSQKVLAPTILHSLSFTSQRIGSNIQISVNYDDGHIEDDFRMTGNIFLPVNEHITVDPEVILTVNRSKTTNRNTLVNGDFINETVFIAAGDSSLKISDSSTMLLDEGSTTIFRADSQLSLEGNARIVVRNGSLLCIQTDNVALHPDSRIILDGGSLSISSGIDISANIENVTPEIPIPPSIFDNVFFCDPHPDVVNSHSIFGTTTGNDICGSDVLVTDVQAVRLTSQEVINIEPGFEVEAGGFFEANIHTIADDCTIEFFFGTDGEPVEFAGIPGGIGKKTSEGIVTLDALIYPNPSRGDLHIEIKDADGPFTYILKNLSGRTLSEHGSSRSEFTMDISKFERGVYILIVSNGKEMVSKQVVKL